MQPSLSWETASRSATQEFLNVKRSGSVLLNTFQVEQDKSSLSLSLSLWLYSPLKFGRLSTFLILHMVGRTPWTGGQPVERPLPTHRTQTQNKLKKTSMPRVGFEPTISVFEQAKAVHALDSAATVIGARQIQVREFTTRNTSVSSVMLLLSVPISHFVF
jgi:hypothetical protein